MNNLAQIAFDVYKNDPNRKLIHYQKNGNWESYTALAFAELICSATQFLESKSVKEGSKVILVPSMTNAYVIAMDCAVQSIGGISCMVHSTTTETHWNAILSELHPELIICSETNMLQKIDSSYHDITLSLDKQDDQEKIFKGACDIGSWKTQSQKWNEDHLSSIIYTSGSTGEPKGVMLSHKNLYSNVISIVDLLPLPKRSRIMSFLPYSHVFERTMLFAYLKAGASLYFPSSRNDLFEAYGKVKPHMFNAVPRIIEVMYKYIQDVKSNSGPIQKKIIDWSLRLAEKFDQRGQMNLSYRLKLGLARILVFRKFRKKFGGQLIGILVGAAKLNPMLSNVFQAAGIPMREGYGMTETSPAIAVNRFGKGEYKFGSVGRPIKDVKVKIDIQEDSGFGEILVEGDNVMLGYYKNESITQASFQDGWLKTGDLGYLDEDGFLFINDRKKNIFKTSSGKYVSPGKIEELIKPTDFIHQVMIVGFQKPFVTALVVPNFERLQAFAERQNIHWTSPKYMCLNIKIVQRIKEEIDTLSRGLESHEKIRKVLLIDEPWTIENGLLSPTLKLKRNAILQRNQKIINEAYKLK